MLQFFALATTFYAIYRQLRLQVSQGAIEQVGALETEWASERLLHPRLEVVRALRDGTSQALVPHAPAVMVAEFWEKIGSLARAGYIDPKLLWNSNGPACELWWATLAPWVQRHRAEQEDPQAFVHFEWLASVIGGMARRAGVPPTDAGFIAATVTQGVDALEHRIRIARELRTVIVGSPEVLTHDQAAAPAADGGGLPTDFVWA